MAPIGPGASDPDASAARLRVQTPAPTASTGAAAPDWFARLHALSSVQLVACVGAALLVIGAWPQLLVAMPPLQDLPNHMAAGHILTHPAAYPELVSNGLLKTNSALFAWLQFGGQLLGLGVATRLFTAFVLVLNAFSIPLFLLTFGGRRRAVVGSLFAFPLVHNYFVSMGMLDFALAVPLSLGVLVGLARHRARPSARGMAAVGLLAVFTWYAHVMAMLVVGLLVVIHLGERRAHWRRELTAVALPLVPALLLAVWSVLEHVTEPRGAMKGFVGQTQHATAWELAYNLFAEWAYGFTWLSAPAVLALIGLALGLRNARRKVLLLSPIALASLGVLYCLTPYEATHWFHVNSRLIPYLWFALLVRVPTAIPKWLQRTLLVAAPLYSLALGIDYVRLERERTRFTDGAAYVARGAKLLPLLFESKGASENTHSLLHAWGYYVTERGTSAPLLFAHSRAFALMYRQPPPPRFNHLVLEHFAPSMRSPAELCVRERGAGHVVDDCAEAYRQGWAEFWREAAPAFDQLLLYKPTAEALAQLPPQYELKWNNGDTAVYARRAPRPSEVAGQ